MFICICAMFISLALFKTEASADTITTFRLLGVSVSDPYDGSPSVTGSFDYNFTTGHIASFVNIVFGGGVIANGNMFSSPVSISPSSITAAANSDTLGYDLQLVLTTPLTPTSGSLVTVDPAGTNVNNLNSFLSVDSNGSTSILRITGGSVEPVAVPEPSALAVLGMGAVAIARSKRVRRA